MSEQSCCWCVVLYIRGGQRETFRTTVVQKHKCQFVRVRHFLRQNLYFRPALSYLLDSCLAEFERPTSETKTLLLRVSDLGWKVKRQAEVVARRGGHPLQLSAKLHPVTDTQLLSPGPASSFPSSLLSAGILVTIFQSRQGRGKKLFGCNQSTLVWMSKQYFGELSLNVSLVIKATLQIKHNMSLLVIQRTKL